MSAISVDVPPAALPLKLGHRTELLRECWSGYLPTEGGLLPAVAWKGGGLKVLFSADPTHHGVLRHVSISHKHRHPTWGEIKAVRGAMFAADIDVMMVLPCEEDYVNEHEHCFHLWQCPERWGIQ